MEESKHVCKFCSKSFPCGRSLGGHMRSHMINDISAQTDGTILTKKKLPSLPNLTSITTTTATTNNNNNNNNKKNSSTRANNSNTSTETSGYGLRENPKKTWKLDHSISAEGALTLADKSCKECDKVFPTWKALFCHMKSHSSSAAAEKERMSNNNNSSEEQQDSWASGNNQKSVQDSQSDNEAAAPSRGKRSKRRTRYMMATANSSSLSFAAAANNNNNHNHNNASSPVSEIEQEQEEVAMCLMMLSRDIGQWGGLNSAAESSDNNSVFLENNRQGSKAEGKKAYICKDNETAKVKAFDQKKLESVKMEVEDSKIPGKAPVKNNDRARKSQLNEQSGDEIENLIIKETGIDQECNSSKRKFREAFDTAELRPADSLKKPANKKLDSEACRNSDRGSKFECATCNKVFHSYQALGGHRASHKKIKGCFASKIESSENSIETEHSPDPTADASKVIGIKSVDNEVPSNGNLALDEDCDNDNKQAAETSYGAKKSKGHECPVCLKVFPSGQALGGHKRSHLVAGSSTEVKTEQIAIPIPEVPIPAIRNFLDLNLPAPVEEESNGIAGFNTWWIGGSNHKQEALVGLISN